MGWVYEKNIADNYCTGIVGRNAPNQFGRMTSMCVYIYIYIVFQIYMYVNPCVYIYIYIYVHVHAYMYSI